MKSPNDQIQRPTELFTKRSPKKLPTNLKIKHMSAQKPVNGQRPRLNTERGLKRPTSSNLVSREGKSPERNAKTKAQFFEQATPFSKNRVNSLAKIRIKKKGINSTAQDRFFKSKGKLDVRRSQQNSFITGGEDMHQKMGESHTLLPIIDDKFINHPGRQIPSKTEKRVNKSSNNFSFDPYGMKSTEALSESNIYEKDIKAMRYQDVNSQQSKYIVKIQQMLKRAPYNEYSNKNLQSLQKRQ